MKRNKLISCYVYNLDELIIEVKIYETDTKQYYYWSNHTLIKPNRGKLYESEQKAIDALEELICRQ